MLGGPLRQLCSPLCFGLWMIGIWLQRFKGGVRCGHSSGKSFCSPADNAALLPWRGCLSSVLHVAWSPRKYRCDFSSTVFSASQMFSNTLRNYFPAVLPGSVCRVTMYRPVPLDLSLCGLLKTLTCPEAEGGGFGVCVCFGGCRSACFAVALNGVLFLFCWCQC